MLKRFKGSRRQVIPALKRWLSHEGRVLATSSSVAGVVLLIRFLGVLQPSEWALFDQYFRWRPLEPIDERIVIIGIDEQDLQKYGFPTSDGILAQLLEKVNAAKPRAIGLDIYRDLPIEPGQAELEKAFKTIPNLIGIELLETDRKDGVRPPEILKDKKEIGFNNLARDADGKVRRGLLYSDTEDGETHTSFALKLALIYLKYQGIKEESYSPDSNELKLKNTVFNRFKPNDGSYIRANDRGYQFLVNLRGPSGTFPSIPMRDILENRVSPDVIKNRIVIIGSKAASIKDFELTSYSDGVFKASAPIYGVELQAQLVSQIISSVLDGRTLIKVWPEPLEWLWIFGWSWVGATLSWKLQSPRRSVGLIMLMTIGITGATYLAFLGGWWIPVIPANLALVGSAGVIIAHFAHLQGQLKRSTEFLQSIINTIPDPIFVKNKDHEKLVLNQAYCKFVGYPLNVLMEKSDEELFPKYEAELFRQQDELAFHTTWEQENEEQLTDAHGITHYIATKRSLHRDAAGNLFLVGVIRDITERKLLEDNLKQIAAELKRSNAELRVSAEHDPLTGLPNRTLFNERLSQSLEWAESQNRLVALLFLDLNDFKDVNDNQGHHIGDLLLKTVANRLKGCLRGSDTVSRLGGDEFTVILPGIPSKSDAARVAQKILDTITQETVLEGHHLIITTSIGISFYPTDTQDLETLIKLADTAMYRAKSSGKNLYEFANL
ncbi:CHASE2 domain-containing protein [Planktothrix sp. FACHB-1365]|uniref:CHASE2 domain-containing protein n=1 Tax=Planktothrix sp. FACHB-1365 TaxID=2692855 RepID=UPI00168443EB|nr:CHASE2 domain-containing protein [Planktothrix sp. FACHB-1365]MBD2480695.1 CHASE2 domain-containing protein [Planktothrix sp. FACHB-1365]